MTGFNTKLIHGQNVNDNQTGAVNVPVYNSSTYAYPDVNGKVRWDYARSGNPTREYLEKQIALLEHGANGFAFASGMAAIHAAFAILKWRSCLDRRSDLWWDLPIN
nr:PLP-dependent transferase [Paucilactobacillus hokkaidonensis]